ncbi:MAG: nitroreductase family deazaflavin-dependent oxidoreductase, partial [Candidatus Dormibacteria bacterium]
ATFNRHVTNRLTGRLATRLPGFGVVLHDGRRSGRHYRTPVNVFPVANGYVMALTYGSGADWVKNVLAANGCEVVTRGRTERLASPRLIHDESATPVPAAVRPILRRLHVSEFLELSRAAA